MTAREEILARIASATEAPSPVLAPPTPDEPTPVWEGRHLALFVERVRDYGAAVFEVAEAEAAALVARLVADNGASWDSAVIAPSGLDDAWLAELPLARVRRDEPPLGVGELDAAGAVVTGCAVGIAETGTLVLDGSADQGRRVLTLVPDHHIVLIRADQVVPSVAEAVSRLVPTRPLTFVSGPSATSDIELSRVEGVHGPRRLDVLVLGS